MSHFGILFIVVMALLGAIIGYLLWKNKRLSARNRSLANGLNNNLDKLAMSYQENEELNLKLDKMTQELEGASQTVERYRTLHAGAVEHVNQLQADLKCQQTEFAAKVGEITEMQKNLTAQVADLQEGLAKEKENASALAVQLAQLKNLTEPKSTTTKARPASPARPATKSRSATATKKKEATRI